MIFLTNAKSHLLAFGTTIFLRGLLWLGVIGATSLAYAEPALLVDNSFSITNTLGAQGLIAFTASDGVSDRINLLDLTNNRVLKLVTFPGNNSDPAFSPDGQHLAFVSDRDGDSEIFLSNWDGSNAIQITFNQVSDDNPVWSGDGQSIIFYTNASSQNSNLFALSLSQIQAGSFAPQRLTNLPGRNTTPNSSNDASMLAYSTNRFAPGWDVCVINLPSGVETCPLGASATTFCRPKWAHLTKRFVYSFGVDDNIDLGIYNALSGQTSVLTSLPHKEYDAAWSPQDDFIAYSYNSNGGDQYDLQLVALSSGRSQLLLRGIPSLRFISWTTNRPYQIAEEDLCPSDELKTVPGICGCGVLDVDSDFDNIYDCQDACPLDALKSSPGACGCGLVDPPMDGSSQLACQPKIQPTPWVPGAPSLKVRRMGNKRKRLIITLPKISEAIYEVNLKIGSKERRITTLSHRTEIFIKRATKVSVYYRATVNRLVSEPSSTVEKG